MQRSSCRSRYFAVIAMAIAGSLAAPRTSLAQADWRPSLRLDNDVYNFWQRHTRRPDEEYTNGVHASLESQAGPWWGRRFAGGIRDCLAGGIAESCRSTVVTLGQELYTPHLDRTPHAVDNWELERPYFAWLFVRAVARVSSARTLHETAVSLGVTGPPAGGALAQDIAHRIGFNEQASGWETQIGFEPGIVAGYRRRELLARASLGRSLAFDLAPDAGLALGNVRANAEAGLTARVGRNLSHPWHTPLWGGRPASEWWLSAGARAEYVARDMSLDGTLVNPTRRVERIAGISQYEFGAGFRFRTVTVEYRAVTRSREYRTGPGHHTWSSMKVSLTPR